MTVLLRIIVKPTLALATTVPLINVNSTYTDCGGGLDLRAVRARTFTWKHAQDSKHLKKGFNREARCDGREKTAAARSINPTVTVHVYARPGPFAVPDQDHVCARSRTCVMCCVRLSPYLR